jgi:hypothetical protein
MGGWGSGLYDRIKGVKRIVENSLSLNILWFKRKGLLTPGSNIALSWSRGDTVLFSIEATAYENYLLLRYTNKKTEDVEQKINFTYTPCNYGGKRIWFLCPSCGRRCAIIYIHKKYFACRVCCDLTYRTCNETPRDRRFSKANKLRQLIGARPGALNCLPYFKPKGMHQRTWDMVRLEIKCLEIKGISEICRLIGA